MSEKIYGIDLGTTNSIIGCDDKIISRLVSSKVNLNDEKSVPHNEIGDNIIGSYKVDMGLGAEGEVPIKASSIILKELISIVKNETGDDVKNVIISVPAYFSTNQRTAVRKAAEMVGLNLISVINEPTAAAIAICENASSLYIRREVIVVYDLGGGTFDCTVIDSRSGKYNVIGTDGRILGGDDLDKRLADYLMDKAKVPFDIRSVDFVQNTIVKAQRLKLYMQEKYKSYERESSFCEVNLISKYSTTFSLKEYKEIVREVFGPTVTLLSVLVDKCIGKNTDYKIIFVGGSTHDAYLCSYVLEQAHIPFTNAEFSSAPDYMVAQGVILYATSIQNGNDDIVLNDVTKQLSIADNNGRAIVIIPANTTIPCSITKQVTNSEDTDKLVVKLYQGNSVVEALNEYIGTLQYDYEEVMKKGKGDVDITISVDSSGVITLEVEDFNTFSEKKSIQLKGF